MEIFESADIPEPRHQHPDFERIESREVGDEVEAQREGDVIGHPDQLADYWQRQQGPNECAIAAQGMIVEASGRSYDRDAVIANEQANGSYDLDTGTRGDDIGHVLESQGIPVDQDGGFDNPVGRDEAWSRLADDVSGGKGVIVGLDARPIWSQDSNLESSNVEGHAVWVTGLEHDGAAITGVMCNDSGREDGQAIRYDAALFDKAWSRFGYLNVSTRNPII